MNATKMKKKLRTAERRVEYTSQRIGKLREFVRKFLAATGHDLCHVNRQELAFAFGLDVDEYPWLPSEAEFADRCIKYRHELYGHKKEIEMSDAEILRRSVEEDICYEVRSFKVLVAEVRRLRAELAAIHAHEQAKAFGVEMKEYQIAAMQALFDFDEAMDKGGLSIADLIEVISKSIENGHDMLLIELNMTTLAVEQAKALIQ